MRKVIKLFGCIVVIYFGSSCTNPKKTNNEKYLKNVQTVESTIETLYSVISGEEGETRDWELFEYLFHENGRLINYQPNKDGIWETRFRSPEEYVKTSGKYFEGKGFYEKQIAIEIDSFGKIAVVRSIYESYNSKFDEKPFMRGYNSFQMLYHEDRWWIVTNYWLRETEPWSIPEEYLKK